MPYMTLLRDLPWKLFGLGLLAVLLALSTMNAAMWKARAGKFEQQAIRSAAALQRMAHDSERLARATAKRVEQAKGRIVVVEKQARAIEASPIAGKCETGPAVMGADL